MLLLSRNLRALRSFHLTIIHLCGLISLTGHLRWPPLILQCGWPYTEGSTVFRYFKKILLLEWRFYACVVCLPHPPSVCKWNRGMFCCQGKGLDARIAWLKALYKWVYTSFPEKEKNLEKLTWANLKPDFHIIVRIVSIVCYRDVSQKMCRGDRVNHLGKTFWCDKGRSG